jgi:hypothetical protein
VSFALYEPAETNALHASADDEAAGLNLVGHFSLSFIKITARKISHNGAGKYTTV